VTLGRRRVHQVHVALDALENLLAVPVQHLGLGVACNHEQIFARVVEREGLDHVTGK